MRKFDTMQFNIEDDWFEYDSLIDLWLPMRLQLKNTNTAIPVLKDPATGTNIQILLKKIKPNVIIETGTHRAGSAKFFVDELSEIHVPNKNYLVITLDIIKSYKDQLSTMDGKPYPKGCWYNILQEEDNFDNIKFVTVDSSKLQALYLVKSILKRNFQSSEDYNILVSLDADHTCEHVFKELMLYSTLIKPGGYIVVEDTIEVWFAGAKVEIQGYNIGGPLAAVIKFLRDTPEGMNFDIANDDFELVRNEDGRCHNFPYGLLKRIS